MHLVAVLNMERRRQVAVVAGAERRPAARLLARADRPGRRRAGRRDQRARTGPHAARHARIPHRVRLADRRPKDVRHDVPRRHRSVRRRHLFRRRGAPTLRIRDGPRRRARRRRPRRLGRARDARSGSNPISFEGVQLPESGVAAASAPETRCRTWSATWSPGYFTPRPRSGSPSRPTRRPPRPRRADRRRRPPAHAGRRQHHRPRRLARRHLARGDADRRAPRRQPGLRRQRRELGALFAEAQAAKAFVNEAAARIVDRALALSGGAGYLNGSPLARAYRDVKAGTFMHPLGANRAYDYLGHVALGEETSLH